MQEGLKLTVYFGERDRAHGSFLADALAALYARHELRTSLIMRGMSGFGAHHHLRTDRLLSLSEDLPLVSVAVDTRERIERALVEVRRLGVRGLVTLERATVLTGELPAQALPWRRAAATKLTVYVGRHQKINGTTAHEAVVTFLHARGVAGATVLLGVDGTVHGTRQRASFLGRNADVPLMVIAVGDSQAIGALLPDLGRLLPEPLVTLERLRVCKRDGVLLSPPRELPDTDASGLPMWQKLMVYTGEDARCEGRPLHQRLMLDLRRAGAAGATSLRGIWGYHGDHTPHGDSFWQLHRRVPVVTVVVDTPARARRWFAVVDRITRRTGLVTSEMVPAFHAGGEAESELRLAQRLDGV